MISVIPGRRRAEEFARAVDAASETGSDTASDKGSDGGLGDGPGAPSRSTGELLEVVGALRDVEHPEPRPEFVASLRTRLMAEADEVLTDVDAKLTLPAHNRSGRDRRLAVAAGAIAVVAGTGSVAVASQDALPGDTLYPVKRVLEGAQTSITLGDEAQASRALETAGSRLAEIEQLAAQYNTATSPDAATTLSEALEDFTGQAEDAAELKIGQFEETGDTKPIAQLREFTATGVEQLGLLDGMLPSESMDALRGAVHTLTDIDARAASLCPSCGDVLELPQSLINALQASTTAPKRVAPTTPTLADLLDQTPIQRGNDHPTLPTVDPDLLGPATDGTPLDEQRRGTGGETGKTAPENEKGNGNPDGDDHSEDTPLEKKGKKAVKDLDRLVDKGSDTLTGNEGPLSPLNPLLDPLLGPLVGKGGLLNPDR